MHKNLTKEELDSWKHNPVTIQFRQYLIDYRESLKESFIEGEFLRESAEAQLSMAAQTVAKCRSIKDVVTTDYEDIAVFYGWDQEVKND